MCAEMKAGAAAGFNNSFTMSSGSSSGSHTIAQRTNYSDILARFPLALTTASLKMA